MSVTVIPREQFRSHSAVRAEERGHLEFCELFYFYFPLLEIRQSNMKKREQ